MDIGIKEAARNIVTAYWKLQFDGWDQGRRAYLFDEGLIDSAEADAWAMRSGVTSRNSIPTISAFDGGHGMP